MKIFSAGILGLLFSINLQAQTADEQLQKANTLYKQFKEKEALDAYKAVLSIDPNNMTVLVKCTELSSSLGKKQTDKDSKNSYYIASKDYADKALAADSNNPEAYYAEALAFANLSQIEDENKKVVEDVKQIKIKADKGLAINPDNAMLNYMEGKWHYEMLALNWFKKTALKVFYSNGMPKPDLDSAIFFMEKCKTEEPYFVQNYLDISKAYHLKNEPAREMDMLAQMVKLPNRMADDAELKAEGKKRLQELQ